MVLPNANVITTIAEPMIIFWIFFDLVKLF